MPELPEVEVLRKQLASKISGREVVAAGSHWSKKFTPARKVIGAQLTDVRRRGKYLLIGTADDRELIIHLGMSGSIALLPELDTDRLPESEPYCRAWWSLSDANTMLLRDTRRFGRVIVTQRGDYAGLGTLSVMGPEPFDPSLDALLLWRRSRKSTQQIKTQLLGQRLVAGVGNIYADEALFASGIKPTLRQITKAQAERLLDALRKVLCEGIANGGTTLRDYANLSGSGENQHHLACYGRAGQPCVKCGAVLKRTLIDARSTTWCGACQT